MDKKELENAEHKEVTEIDWDSVLEEFDDWINSQEKSRSRLDRYVLVMAHMALAVATNGAYIVLYMFYYFYAFIKATDFEEHEKTYEVKKTEKQDEPSN